MVDRLETVFYSSINNIQNCKYAHYWDQIIFIDSNNKLVFSHALLQEIQNNKLIIYYNKSFVSLSYLLEIEYPVSIVYWCGLGCYLILFCDGTISIISKIHKNKKFISDIQKINFTGEYLICGDEYFMLVNSEGFGVYANFSDYLCTDKKSNIKFTYLEGIQSLWVSNYGSVLNINNILTTDLITEEKYINVESVSANTSASDTPPELETINLSNIKNLTINSEKHIIIILNNTELFLYIPYRISRFNTFYLFLQKVHKKHTISKLYYYTDLEADVILLENGILVLYGYTHKYMDCRKCELETSTNFPLLHINYSNTEDSEDSYDSDDEIYLSYGFKDINDTQLKPIECIACEDVYSLVNSTTLSVKYSEFKFPNNVIKVFKLYVEYEDFEMIDDCLQYFVCILSTNKVEIWDCNGKIDIKTIMNLDNSELYLASNVEGSYI